MNENAIKLFDALPEDGSKLSGSKLRELTGLSKGEYDAAKKELKDEKVIVLGGGRGGTVGRVEGAKIERPKKVSRDEALEHAREAKATKTKAQRELDIVKAKVVKLGWKIAPDADEVYPRLYSGEWYAEIWKDRRATVKFFQDEDLL